jgi:hypothetical protein
MEEITELKDCDKLPISEEEIDQNLDGSFPASDPPSWNLGTDHSVSGRETKTAQELHQEQEAYLLRRPGSGESGVTS